MGRASMIRVACAWVTVGFLCELRAHRALRDVVGNASGNPQQRANPAHSRADCGVVRLTRSGDRRVVSVLV
jgi:hypothetical protein